MVYQIVIVRLKQTLCFFLASTKVIESSIHFQGLGHFFGDVLYDFSLRKHNAFPSRTFNLVNCLLKQTSNTHIYIYIHNWSPLINVSTGSSFLYHQIWKLKDKHRISNHRHV